MIVTYILDNKIPVATEDLTIWGRWMCQKENRLVAFTKIGRTKVSTIFLGIDHQGREKENPILFETMAFDDDSPIDKHTVRYYTWDKAEKGHQRVVALVKAENELNT